jgi:hypothetical protein
MSIRGPLDATVPEGGVGRIVFQLGLPPIVLALVLVLEL